MNPLKALNVFLLQWLFVRLTKCQETVVSDFTLLGYDSLPNGNVSSKGVAIKKTYQWYSLQMWILPCTGWWSDFIYLNKNPYFLKITKRKLI